MEIIQVGAYHNDFQYTNFTCWLQSIVLSALNLVQIRDSKSQLVKYQGFFVTSYAVFTLFFNVSWSPFVTGLRWQFLKHNRSHIVFRRIQFTQIFFNSVFVVAAMILVIADFSIVTQLRNDLQLQFWQLNKPLTKDYYQKSLIDQHSLTSVCTGSYKGEALNMTSLDEFVGGISYDG